MNTLLVSTRKGLVIYRNNGGAWKPAGLHFRGIPVTLSYYDTDTGALWAFQDHGHWGVKMHRSFDQGKNWEEVAAPKYPEGSEVKDGVPATLSYIWAVERTAGKLMLGTVPGGLFESSDGGSTWNLNQNLWNLPERPTYWLGGGMNHPGIHSIVADPVDSQHFFIAISCAGVYETRDGGKSWKVMNKGLKAPFLPDPDVDIGHDPHLLLACPASPRHMWQQNHCGIFRSTDGAATWEEVSESEGPANFGFAIAVHETNPEVAWVIPAVSDELRLAVNESLCVCRTDDGGKTWRAFRAGLPQDNAFDIVYRHAMDNNGDEMFFGTTTGNLFRSGDGGESWETISNYLPLINAVQYTNLP